MPQITLIAETNSVLSTVVGAADTFMTANFSDVAMAENHPWFDIQIASITGEPVSGYGNISVT